MVRAFFKPLAALDGAIRLNVGSLVGAMREAERLGFETIYAFDFDGDLALIARRLRGSWTTARSASHPSSFFAL